jgi:pimeloyl-ACP methyl ester carboxylesterase
VRVTETGSGPRLVLVHGSVGNGESTWAAQKPLAERFTLVVLDRPGSPPNPPVERVDFEEHAQLLADLLQPGDHLCGHSYGGVISLLAAARRPELLRSLTVIEPPCFGVAREDPAVQELVARLAPLWSAAGPSEPDEFLQRFFTIVAGPEAADALRSPLPPLLEQGTRTLMVERSPWEAEIPLADLAAAGFPTLVVSGAHSAAFDAVCDVLERALSAQRAVVPGATHAAQRAPGFNELLERFLASA